MSEPREFCGTKYFKYKPETKKVKTKKIKCPKCFGRKYYSGVHGAHACDECDKGYVYEQITQKKIEGVI